MSQIQGLTPSQVAECKTDLLTFAQTVFTDNFSVNWHHKLICQNLEKVILGEITRLVINIPPRYSKTELAVVMFVAWCLGICPDSRFIHVSYSKKLAVKNSANIKAIVESDIYQEIFGPLELKDDSRAKDDWETKAGGIVYATGSEGTITGFGAGRKRKAFGGAIIIDDPHKAGETSSEVRRQNVLDWFTTTLESRKNSRETPIIVIMQRLHEEDLTGFLLDGGNGEKWHHLKIPALDEFDRPLWPDMHDKNELLRMQKTSPYVFEGQYMQEPAPLGGGLFKYDWWKFYDLAPNVEYKIITADTAQKTAEHNDYSVFQCWGYLDGNIYLLDQIRGKWEAPELKTMCMAFWNKHYGTGQSIRGALRAIYIEDKASGTGLIQDLQIIEKIPVVPVQRNIDKVSRAMDMAPWIASGYVYIPRESEYINDYLMEFGRFTPLMTHSHDYQIDPTLDAINMLLRPADRESGTWRTET